VTPSANWVVFPHVLCTLAYNDEQDIEQRLQDRLQQAVLEMNQLIENQRAARDNQPQETKHGNSDEA
jgi:predicted nuclease of restriction endonuclease-like (RecB) superfamily